MAFSNTPIKVMVNQQQMSIHEWYHIYSHIFMALKPQHEVIICPYKLTITNFYEQLL